jgi:hypothetical protein
MYFEEKNHSAYDFYKWVSNFFFFNMHFNLNLPILYLEGEERKIYWRLVFALS